MKIILDAMGGDLAPQAPVMGAVRAAKELGAQITLVGRGEEILKVLKDNGIQDLPTGITVSDAEEVVDMHDDPANVIRKKKNSSMVIGLRMLSEENGDAFVSAGSTGALLSGATLIVKRVKGIRRAAMGPCMPNKAGGKTMLLDCGANAECTPEFLLQFGLVGSLYMKKSCGLENPRVGLLNIGTEETKGTPLQKEAYALLQDAHEKGLINFIGNVEVDFDKLAALPKKYFTWKDGDDSVQIGTSAQEVQKVYPEIVNTDDAGKLSVDYTKLSVIALSAIDKLNEKNKELEDRLHVIESLLSKLNIK